MKVLIAYASKHGVAASCVERLEQELRGVEVSVVSLEEKQPDPADYDIVVFGSSVYFGKLRPAARQFLQQNEEILAQKPLGLFLVCGLSHEYEYYRDKLLPVSLREHAFQTLYFGGLLKTEGLPFLEKMLVRSIRASLFEENMDDGEYTPTLPALLPENIDRMATYVRREILNCAEQRISKKTCENE